MSSGMRRVVGRVAATGIAIAGGLSGMQAHAESDGPYRVIGYNFTDRGIDSFTIDGFGAGNVRAHKPGGYIEFYFLPERKIDARWVISPTDPHNPNTTSNASSTTN